MFGPMFGGLAAAMKIVAIIVLVVAAALWLGIIAMGFASFRKSEAVPPDATAW
jgi:hypothetical protein